MDTTIGKKHEGTARVEGATLRYERWGEGEPLLLLHGFTGSAGDFAYAGRERFLTEYALILPDARGHGGSSNELSVIRHDQCARDTLALLDHLGIARCKAVGLSMGGNILLHMACMAPERIEAMVLVSATTHFPEQARAIMRALPAEHSEDEWRSMRTRHVLGDAQIRGLWEAQRAFSVSYDDMNFGASELSQIQARTLVITGDQDPLYPVAIAESLAREIPQAELAVVSGGHCPVFLDASDAFATRCLSFLRGPRSRPASSARDGASLP